MRFFTRDWASGGRDDAHADTVLDEYRAHCARIASCVPEQLSEFMETVSLHDGLIVEGTFDAGQQRLDLTIRCGDLQSGYRDVRLAYSGVKLRPAELDGASTILNRPESEMLYDEIDVLPEGLLAHRMLFWPSGEIEFRFAGFAFEVQRRESREFGARGNRFKTLD